MTAYGYRISFQGGKNVLELDRGVVAQHRECPKYHELCTLKMVNFLLQEFLSQFKEEIVNKKLLFNRLGIVAPTSAKTVRDLAFEYRQPSC